MSFLVRGIGTNGYEYEKRVDGSVDDIVDFAGLVGDLDNIVSRKMPGIPDLNTLLMEIAGMGDAIHATRLLNEAVHLCLANARRIRVFVIARNTTDWFDWVGGTDSFEIDYQNDPKVLVRRVLSTLDRARLRRVGYIYEAAKLLSDFARSLGDPKEDASIAIYFTVPGLD